MKQMNEFDVSAVLCKLYGLGTLQNVTPIKPGTVSRVWKFSTVSGEFLARTLTDAQQGKTEWAIFRHLAQRGFHRTPAILTTSAGMPMLELDGVWYQVQQFCPGSWPTPARPGIPREMARLTTLLEQALSDCPAIDGPPDRFDLAAVWQTCRENWPLLGLPLPLEAADREVDRCCQFPTRGAQVIHGDLGPWNLLQTEDNSILVIDFGEARMGDPYFDLASILGGLVNHSSAERRKQACEEFLLEYQRFTPLDQSRLLEQLDLWVWRGLAQCARSIPQPNGNWSKLAARFLHALNWAKENI